MPSCNVMWRRASALRVAALILFASSAAFAQSPHFKVGRTPTPEEIKAGFLLNLNGIIAEQDVMDAKTLPAVRMPNRDGFVPDPRPDVGPNKAALKK